MLLVNKFGNIIPFVNNVFMFIKTIANNLFRNLKINLKAFTFI